MNWITELLFVQTNPEISLTVQNKPLFVFKWYVICLFSKLSTFPSDNGICHADLNDISCILSAMWDWTHGDRKKPSQDIKHFYLKNKNSNKINNWILCLKQVSFDTWVCTCVKPKETRCWIRTVKVMLWTGVQRLLVAAHGSATRFSSR